MAVRISKLYGMDIFSDGGKYIGKVYDIVVDVEKGEVVRLTLESMKGTSKEEIQRVIKEKTILYKNVKSVGDVIVVTKSKEYAYSPEEESEHGSEFGFLK